MDCLTSCVIARTGKFFIRGDITLWVMVLTYRNAGGGMLECASYLSKLPRACLMLLVLLSGFFELAMAEGKTQRAVKVGEVALLIGKAAVTHIDGLKEALQRGDSLYAGDLVETNLGDHVHIRFIDDGVISVRPDSRLHIELYNYDLESPEKSAIRFRLDKGVVRSISGKATKAARDRYRLNTPVAALGVLGTDYVVKVKNGEMWVAVYSGGVAVAPFGQGCLAADLGVCQGATQLTKEMGNVVLTYSLGGKKVQLKPLSGALEEGGVMEPEQAPEMSLNLGSAPIDEQLAERKQLGEDIGPGMEKPELSGDLEWASWWVDSLQGDKVSVPYEQASDGREITIGDGRFGLFRDAATSFDLMPKQGVFNFSLIQSFVYFFDRLAVAGAQPTAGKLNKGTLELDFANKVFSTHLDLSHPTAGNASLDVNGVIGSNGAFYSKAGPSSVAGALTGDGKEAGLLFEHKVSEGRFKGISSWAR